LGGQQSQTIHFFLVGAVMNVSTRHELQTLLEKIRATQTSPDGSPLAYRVAWIELVVLPFVAAWIIFLIPASYWFVPLMILLPFFIQAFYAIIQYNVNKRLRPILEAVLYVPEVPPKQDEQIPKTDKKAGNARPIRRKKK
jgi:hypothetical protein